MRTPRTLLVISALLTGIPIAAQQSQAPLPVQQQTPQTAQLPSPATTQGPTNDGKVRIYVSDSQSWQMSGGWGAANGAGGGHESGGARPQTAEIIKTFNQRCPEYTITNNRERANYAVILDHEGGKGALARRNKIALFNRDGDAIFSDSTRALGNSVKDACAAIQKDQASLKK
ncbi:MAG: hypothetical protein ACHP8A_15435 [Terriglobales bacterium]